MRKLWPASRAWTRRRLPPIRRTAELRAQAAVDRITGGYTSDEVEDWQGEAKVEGSVRGVEIIISGIVQN